MNEIGLVGHWKLSCLSAMINSSKLCAEFSKHLLRIWHSVGASDNSKLNKTSFILQKVLESTVIHITMMECHSGEPHRL